jgi:hypothetical protein
MTLTGDFATRTVRLDGRPLDPAPSQRVWNHSPDGFNWGYGGSGPAQLALGILLSVGLDAERAVALHQQLKWDLVARLPQASFSIEFDLTAWLRDHDAATND